MASENEKQVLAHRRAEQAVAAGNTERYEQEQRERTQRRQRAADGVRETANRLRRR